MHPVVLSPLSLSPSACVGGLMGESHLFLSALIISRADMKDCRAHDTAGRWQEVWRGSLRKWAGKQWVGTGVCACVCVRRLGHTYTSCCLCASQVRVGAYTPVVKQHRCEQICTHILEIQMHFGVCVFARAWECASKIKPKISCVKLCLQNKVEVCQKKTMSHWSHYHTNCVYTQHTVDQHTHIPCSCVFCGRWKCVCVCVCVWGGGGGGGLAEVVLLLQ